jgi:hypothetical protein
MMETKVIGQGKCLYCGRRYVLASFHPQHCHQNPEVIKSRKEKIEKYFKENQPSTDNPMTKDSGEAHRGE